MLRGHHDLLHIDGLVIDVADRDLGLAVGAQVGHGAVLAHRGQLLGHALCQVDGHGHERGRLVASVTEHHALVAGADLLVRIVARLAVLGLVALIDALSDVGALVVDGVEHAAGIAVEAVLARDRSRSRAAPRARARARRRRPGCGSRRPRCIMPVVAMVSQAQRTCVGSAGWPDGET